MGAGITPEKTPKLNRNQTTNANEIGNASTLAVSIYASQDKAVTVSTTHCHHGHCGRWQWRSPERTPTRRKIEKQTEIILYALTTEENTYQDINSIYKCSNNRETNSKERHLPEEKRTAGGRSLVVAGPPEEPRKRRVAGVIHLGSS